MRQLSPEELNRKSPLEFAAFPKIKVSVVCDNLRSAHNVGALFRTADGFAVEHLHICGITVTPPNNEIHKAALGAEFTVPWTHWEQTGDCISELKRAGYQVIALEQTDESVPLQGFCPLKNKPIALVLGNEVKGISPGVLALCDQALEIPMEGTKHSLNVSVAAGIVLWELYKSFKW